METSIHRLPGFLPCGSDSKESACNAGDPCSIPGLKRSPEEGMAIHSSVLPWRFPWPEEPGRLQSMGSQRVAHNLVTFTHRPHQFTSVQ